MPTTTTYTFTCANFVSTDQGVPDPNNPCSSCLYPPIQYAQFNDVFKAAHYHVITEHGYQDNLQFCQDIANCITSP